jgi:DNA-binding CsgD family transcriptional regulator
VALIGTPALVLRDGQVVYANRAAEEMLQNSPVLRVQAGVLLTRRQEEGDAIARLVTEFGQAASIDKRIRILTLHNRQARAIMILSFQALALPEVGRMLVMRVDDLCKQPTLDQDRLISVFGLTRAEARVAAALFAGQGVAGIANALQLGPETVRSHLKRLRDKLGVTTRMQVVAMLHSGMLAQGEKI